MVEVEVEVWWGVGWVARCVLLVCYHKAPRENAMMEGS